MFLEKMMVNPYVWALLALCTFGAIIFTVYTRIADRRKKEITLYKNSQTIIKGGRSIIPKLRISYGYQDIDDLTISKYAIWNSGKEVLSWSDVVEEKALQITANENAEILDATIICMSDTTNKFVVEAVSNNKIMIKFDYADVKEGFVIQVLHTGKSTDLEFDCKIKGGKKVKELNKIKNKRNKKTMKVAKTVVLGIEVLLTSILTALMIVLMWVDIPKAAADILLQPTGTAWNIIYSILLGLCEILLIALFWRSIKSVFHIDIPVSLRANLEYDDFEIKEEAK